MQAEGLKKVSLVNRGSQGKEGGKKEKRKEQSCTVGQEARKKTQPEKRTQSSEQDSDTTQMLDLADR